MFIVLMRKIMAALAKIGKNDDRFPFNDEPDAALIHYAMF